MSDALPTARSWGFALAAYGTAAHAVLLRGILAYFQYYVPPAKRTFDEYAMVLPLTTQKVIRLSGWIADHSPVFVSILPLVPVAGFVLALGLGRCCRPAQKVWVYGITLVFVLALAAHVAGIEVSLMKLREGLSH